MKIRIILIMILDISITWGQGKMIILQEKAPFTLESAVISSTESEKPDNVSMSLKNNNSQEKRRIKQQMRVAKALSIPLLILGYTCIGSGFLTSLTGFIVDDTAFAQTISITSVSTMGGGMVLIIPGHIFLKRKRRLEKELKKM
jgi:hypothetical protein